MQTTMNASQVAQLRGTARHDYIAYIHTLVVLHRQCRHAILLCSSRVPGKEVTSRLVVLCFQALLCDEGGKHTGTPPSTLTSASNFGLARVRTTIMCTARSCTTHTPGCLEMHCNSTAIQPEDTTASWCGAVTSASWCCAVTTPC